MATSKPRPPVLGLVELAKLKGMTKKQITYLATLNPLPPVVLKSGFDRQTFFYNKEELLKWFDETKHKRGARGPAS